MATHQPAAGGTWRTIHGSRVLIKPGQTPAQAFAESGRGGGTPAPTSAGPNLDALPATRSASGGTPRYEGKLTGMGALTEAQLDEHCKRNGLPGVREAVAAVVVDSKVFSEVRVGRDGTKLVVKGFGDGDGTIIERKLDMANKTVENEFFDLAPRLQGKGLGTKLFAEQVERCSALGFERMETYALRSGSANGYYTWPRLGYDGTISKKMGGADPPNGESFVSELMRTPEGRGWWKENGVSVSLEFDLRPGSHSRKVLAAYKAERGSRN